MLVCYVCCVGICVRAVFSQTPVRVPKWPLVNNFCFCQALAKPSSGGSCIPAPDLVLRRLILPWVSFSEVVFFSQTPACFLIEATGFSSFVVEASALMRLQDRDARRRRTSSQKLAPIPGFLPPGYSSLFSFSVLSCTQ